VHVHEETHEGGLSFASRRTLRTVVMVRRSLILTLQARGDPLISEDLLAVENLARKADLELHQRLRIDDSLARVAVIDKELLVAYQQGLALLDVAGQPARLKIRLEHFSLEFRLDFFFVLKGVVVLSLGGP